MSNEQSDRQLQILVVGLVGGLTCLYLFFTSFWPTALAAWQTWKEKKQVLERIKASTNIVELPEEEHVQARRPDAEVLLVEPNFALQGAVTRASRQPAAEPTPTEAVNLAQPNFALGTAITPPGELQRSVRPPTSSASSGPTARPAPSTSTRTSTAGINSAKRSTRPPAYQGPLTASRPLWMPPVSVDPTAVLRAEQDAAYAESVVRDLELAQEKEQRKRVWKARRESVKESLLPEPQEDGIQIVFKLHLSDVAALPTKPKRRFLPDQSASQLLAYLEGQLCAMLVVDADHPIAFTMSVGYPPKKFERFLTEAAAAVAEEEEELPSLRELGIDSDCAVWVSVTRPG